MKRSRRAALYALGILMAAPASAASKDDFVACDGLDQPGHQDDGMRGAVGTVQSTLTSATAAESIAACTRAIANPRLLPTQQLRRANLLRVRAAAYLQSERPVDALGDLDLAESATANLAGDRFFARSMGVSITLLSALAKAQQGDLPQAMALARAATAARPYALQVQQVAATIEQLNRPAGASAPSPWLPVARLDPGAAAMAVIQEMQIGNFAGVVALRTSVLPDWPKERITQMGLVTHDPSANQMTSALVVLLDFAYARAATGDPRGARTDLAEARTRLTGLRPDTATGGQPSLTEALNAARDGFVNMRARQIEARASVAEGHPTEALATLIAAPLPHDAASVDLLRALKAATPAANVGLVPQTAAFESDPAQDRRKALVAIVPATLIAPETPRAVIDYARARPDILGAVVKGAFSMGFGLLGGISRTNGFQSTPNADGSVKVEFVGSTPSAPLVQEMTLLRAAEIAHEAGKPTFVIVARKDYTRRLNTTQRGVLIRSVPTGYKTELTIRYVDGADHTARTFDALAIIDALGPLYYENKLPS